MSDPRRILGLVAIIAVGCLAAAAAIAISSGGGPPRVKPSAVVRQVADLLHGIPESGTTLGSADAAVTVTYFGDLECPVCQEFTLTGGFPRLVRSDVRSGLAKVVYRSLCSATCAGPGEAVFDTQQTAAYAAGEQKRFWYYAELFYRQQGAEGSGYVTTAYLDRLAHQVPDLNFARWGQARLSPTLLAQVQADDETAQALAIVGTPTLIVAGPDGITKLPQAVPDYADLAAAIKHVDPGAHA